MLKIYKSHRREYSGPSRMWVDYSGHVGFLCKDCYEPIIVKVNNHMDVTYPYETEPNYILWVAPTYSVICPKCREFNIFDYQIDPNIVTPLSILNRKGYETEFSCEGHNNEKYLYYDDLDNEYRRSNRANVGAYIAFKRPALAKILDYIPLPKIWERDLLVIKYMATLYDEHGNPYEEEVVQDMSEKFIIRCNDYHTDIVSRLAYLYRWINLLPTLEDLNPLESYISSISDKVSHINDPLTEDELKYERID